MVVDLGAENRRGGEHGARGYQKAASAKGHNVRIVVDHSLKAEPNRVKVGYLSMTDLFLTVCPQFTTSEIS